MLREWTLLMFKVNVKRENTWGCVSLVSYLPIVPFASIWFIAQVWWKYMHTHWQKSSLYYVYKDIQTVRLTEKYTWKEGSVTMYHIENIVKGWLKSVRTCSGHLSLWPWPLIYWPKTSCYYVSFFLYSLSLCEVTSSSMFYLFFV